MRTTLKTTTAVLACLNLAVPYPAIAQNGTAPGAPGPNASSICTTDPESQECRDAVAQGLAEDEAQAEEEATGEDQPAEDGDAGEAAAAPDTAADPSAEEGADPATEAGDVEEQTRPAQRQEQESADETPDTGASEDGAAEQEPMPGAEPQADDAGALPSAEEAADELGAEAPAGESNTGDVSEAGADNQAELEGGDNVEDDTAASPGDAGEAEPQAEPPAAGAESPGEDPSGEDASSETAPEPSPAPEDEAEGSDASAAPAPEDEADGSDASLAPAEAPWSTDDAEAPDASPEGETAARDAEPSEATDAEAAAGGATGAEADSPESDGPDSDSAQNGDGGASAEDGEAQTAQQGDEPTAEDAAGAGQNAEGEQPRGTIAAAAANGSDVEDITTETVTEETARSSDEDFATQIDQSPEAASDDGHDDDGLSNLEKALLVGAGALAVGALLRNGREVVASSDDRVVVSGSDGGYELIKDDNALLRRPGSEVQTETYDDGSTRTIVNRPDGSQIVTIRDPELRVVRRVRVTPEGEQILLIDDTEEVQPVDTSTLQARAAESRTYSQSMDREALRQALAANQEFDRRYSLNQVRSIEQVREQVPAIDLETITFATGSAAIPPEQAEQLTQLGDFISSRIEENPREIFLVEGHTDAVGDAAYNLALSDRRAESVALALTEYFDVPPENLVVQGYGEQFLKVETEAAEQVNRRASIRRITPLLQAAAAQ